MAEFCIITIPGRDEDWKAALALGSAVVGGLKTLLTGIPDVNVLQNIADFANTMSNKAMRHHMKPMDTFFKILTQLPALLRDEQKFSNACLSLPSNTNRALGAEAEKKWEKAKRIVEAKVRPWLSSNRWEVKAQIAQLFAELIMESARTEGFEELGVWLLGGDTDSKEEVQGEQFLGFQALLSFGDDLGPEESAIFRFSSALSMMMEDTDNQDFTDHLTEALTTLSEEGS